MDQERLTLRPGQPATIWRRTINTRSRRHAAQDSVHDTRIFIILIVIVVVGVGIVAFILWVSGVYVAAIR